MIGSRSAILRVIASFVVGASMFGALWGILLVSDTWWFGSVGVRVRFSFGGRSFWFRFFLIVVLSTNDLT
ncbi:hypothetical protein Rcae01_00656 [Novipirellula caenicola]|uniref:Uncharacterized protein n=2 Tax=Novipirellula caenicola TaxID=1536901 RepID=A0ABP9VJ35_9BACT